MSTSLVAEPPQPIEPPVDEHPELSVCEGAPERMVFIEAKNTDGWIAIDNPVEVGQ